MIFQNNILHAFQSWKLNNAQLNGNTITIKPNGTIQCIIYPKNGDEAKINEAYKVIVNQGKNKGKLSFTFTFFSKVLKISLDLFITGFGTPASFATCIP